MPFAIAILVSLGILHVIFDFLDIDFLDSAWRSGRRERPDHTLCQPDSLQWSAMSGFYLDPERTKTCRKLKFGAKIKGTERIHDLVEALRKVEAPCAATVVELWSNRMGDRGCEAVIDALETNPTGAFKGLEELDITHNHLTARAARRLARLLERHTAIRRVSLYDNDIGDDGASALAEALAANGARDEGLETLFLERNGIGDAGAAALAEALAGGNTALSHLDLDFNAVGVEGARALAAALGPNAANARARDGFVDDVPDVPGCGSGLRHLDLGANPIGDEGAFALAEALSAEGSLIDHLDVARCGITDAGAVRLAAMLRDNRKLVNLKLTSNDEIRDEGVTAIAAAVRANPVIERVALGGTQQVEARLATDEARAALADMTTALRENRMRKKKERWARQKAEHEARLREEASDGEL
jgi:hypothetical protein